MIYFDDLPLSKDILAALNELKIVSQNSPLGKNSNNLFPTSKGDAIKTSSPTILYTMSHSPNQKTMVRAIFIIFLIVTFALCSEIEVITW